MDIFEGPERLELYPLFRRQTRLGSEHHVGDLTLVRQALDRGDVPEARRYLDYILPQHPRIVHLYLEWIVNLRSRVLERCGPELARQVHQQALEKLRATPGWEGTAAAAVESALEGLPGDLPGMAAGLGVDQSELASQEAPRLAQALESYIGELRARHDLVGWYLWAFSSVLSGPLGEVTALELLRDGLVSGQNYPQLWEAAKVVTPSEFALIAVEHMRAHFSGPAREGAVRVVDEPDRVRVIFEGCGSGQAMRRGGPGRAGYGLVQTPCAYTWGRSGEVPHYCAHCAFGELESARRLGYLAWVTEFDPDPGQPCGWIFYKRPEDIPESYYRRLGLEKAGAEHG